MVGRLLLIVVTSLGLSEQSLAQPVAPSLATPVTVDLAKRTLTDVPFDKYFYFVGQIPDNTGITTVRFEMKKGRDVGDQGYTDLGEAVVLASKQFYKPVVTFFDSDDFLLPDRSYTIRVTALAGGIPMNDYSFTWGFNTTSKFGDHTKLDFGFLYSPSPKALYGYTSVNIYFTPINDETDLQLISNFRRNLFLRASVFLGLAPINLSSDTKQPIKSKYAVGNFVFGIGIRSPFYGSYTPWFHNRVGQKLLQPMRLSLGEMLYTQANANPEITTPVNKHSPFIALTYDFSIAQLLGPIAKLVSP